MAASEEDSADGHRRHGLTGSETIVAPCSTTGPAPRAIVRLSGPGAFVIAGSVTLGARPGPLRRGAFERRVVLDRRGTSCPADLWCFSAPASYTGEDVVELHIPGAPKLVEMVVALLIRAGARLATPGEFTRRALMNGKVDLTRAEAIAALIGARDRDEHHKARALLEGGLARAVATLMDRLVMLIAPIELELDFSDQDVTIVKPADLEARVAALAHDVAALATSSHQGARRLLPRVVLRGPANAGKSALFNALLSADVAITAPVRGTTRDVLCAEWTFEGTSAFLVDTAGDDVDDFAIDRLAGAFRERAVLEADLVLEVCDVRVARWPPSAPRVLCVATMIDLAPHAAAPTDVVAVSNVTSEGIDTLRKRIVRALTDASPGSAAPFLVTARQAGHLDRALHALARAGAALPHHPAELLASDLRAALRELRGLVGAEDCDPVLDRIFRDFCIGK